MSELTEPQTASVDLRHLPRGSMVVVAVSPGVAVFRKEGDAMRELTVRVAMRPEQVAK